MKWWNIMRKERAFYEIRSDVTCACKVYTAYTNARIAEIAVSAMESTTNLPVTKNTTKGFDRTSERKSERWREYNSSNGYQYNYPCSCCTQTVVVKDRMHLIIWRNVMVFDPYISSQIGQCMATKLGEKLFASWHFFKIAANESRFDVLYFCQN